MPESKPEPVDVRTWRCANCAGDMIYEDADASAICIDCGMREYI
jgi:hypothetical protein